MSTQTLDFSPVRGAPRAAKGAFAPAGGVAQITHFLSEDVREMPETTGFNGVASASAAGLLEVRLPKGLLAALQAEAERSGRTLSAEVAALLRTALNAKKRSHVVAKVFLKGRYANIRVLAGSRRRKAVRHG